MATGLVTRARAVVGTLIVGNGPSAGGLGGSPTPVKKILTASYAVAPGTVNAGIATDVSITITGARVGDVFLVAPHLSLETGLIFGGAFVSANDTVKIRVANVTVGNIVAASRLWVVTWIDVT